MDGVLYNIAAMLLKDMLKSPYTKARDYERNVRQVYRDVENLQITLEHTRCKCEGQPLGKLHADFMKRAEIQIEAAYRKEANQTAKGLNDLAEIRSAKVGDDMGDDRGDKEKGDEKIKKKDKSPTRPSLDLSGVQSGNATSRGSGSPRSMSSRPGGMFSPIPIQPTGIYSPRSSTSSFSDPARRHSTSSPRRRTQGSHPGRQKQELLAAPSRPKAIRFEATTEAGREREQALDNLQHGIDRVLGAADHEHEYKAMVCLERVLREVLRLQRSRGLPGSQVGGGLGGAVDELDLAMRTLVAAKTDKQKYRALKDLSYAIRAVDDALYARRRSREQDLRRGHHHGSPVRVGSKRRGKQVSTERSRGYSIQSVSPR